MIEQIPSDLRPGRERADWIYIQMHSGDDPETLTGDLKELAKDDPETFCTLLGDVMDSD